MLELKELGDWVPKIEDWPDPVPGVKVLAGVPNIEGVLIVVFCPNKRLPLLIFCALNGLAIPLTPTPNMCNYDFMY